MTQAITFSAADQALCLRVLKRLQVGPGGVDYELLRQELSVDTKNAAQIRWSRFNSELRKGDTTFTPADQALCLGVLKQLQVGRGGVDYEKLRVELGLGTKNAAQVRWSRFNSKIRNDAPGSLSGKTASDTPSTPSGKTDKTKCQNTSSAKKRKIDLSDEEELTDIQSAKYMKHDGSEGEEDNDLLQVETPTRKLPSRRARVTDFKEIDSESEEGEDDRDGEEDAESAEHFVDAEDCKHTNHVDTPEQASEEGIHSDDEA